MRRMQGLGFVMTILVVLLIEYYAFTAFKFAVRSMKFPFRQLALGFYGLLTVIWFAMLLALDYFRTADFDKGLRNVVIVYFMGLLLSKIIIAIFLLLDDGRRLAYYLIGLFYSKESTPLSVQSGMSRSEFLTKFALLFGGTVFATVMYGMSNRYNYHLKKIKLTFAHLPKAFKGLKIVQISDIHSGSFNDVAAVQKGVDMILAEKPDLILFTGDLVNNKSDEMHDYISVFSKLKAPLGVYSILGNHDYGDYVHWESHDAKHQNLKALKHVHAKLGWRLLLDEHVAIEKDGERFGLIGVENISGSQGFRSYGNLQNAYHGAHKYPFKILMSHDPSHWDSETIHAFKDIDLTLSGHTHGMQFGVEIPWLKWSPIQYVYKRWAGLYQKGHQYLYVNRGYGFLGYPGRVGILPEITVIELV
jgi:predicted MPP superfamily phosphohydrolase